MIHVKIQMCLFFCLPDSLLRSGRFDKVIEMECPKGEEAIKVVKYYLSQKKSLGEVDSVDIARIMNGKSCADLETVVNEAGIYAGYDGRDTITHQDILRACMRMLFDAPEHVKKYESPYIRNYAVHEAGHLVVAEVLEPGSVTFASVGGYVGSNYGVTKIYLDEEINSSIEKIEHNVLIDLAGKASTEVVLGQIDVGCRGDLRKAFRAIDRLVGNTCAYGFDIYELDDSSHALLERKEQLVAMEINKKYQQAKKLLADNRVFLETVIDSLLTKKVLTQQDIRNIRNSL